MEKIFGQNDPKIIEYVQELLHPEDATLQEIRVRSTAAGLPAIQVGGADARHLEVLARAVGARKIVEIGTLGGYSGVCLARALPPDGKLFSFEFSPLHAAVAQESFRKAGLSDRVEVYVGPALEKLGLIESQGPFDLVFIDADKVNYRHYGSWAARNLRIGGTLLADNTFAGGMIADRKLTGTPDEIASVEALQHFNRELAQNPAFRTTMLPTGEGLTMAVKIR